MGKVSMRLSSTTCTSINECEEFRQVDVSITTSEISASRVGLLSRQRFKVQKHSETLWLQNVVGAADLHEAPIYLKTSLKLVFQLV
jgi:hypothetical protein